MSKQVEKSWWFRGAWRPVMGMLLASTLAWATPVPAMESQADFVFGMLGQTVCEFPPPEFDLAAYRQAITDHPDVPLTRGTISGKLSGALVGASGYGDDGRGSYMVGVQGILLDHSEDITVLCVVLAHIGKKSAGAVSAAVVGEPDIDGAKDGDFLGVFKLVRAADDGSSQTYAAGTVTGGTLKLDQVDSDNVSGTLALEGHFTPVGTIDSHPLSIAVDIPMAENMLEPVWTLQRK